MANEGSFSKRGLVDCGWVKDVLKRFPAVGRRSGLIPEVLLLLTVYILMIRVRESIPRKRTHKFKESPGHE